MTHYWHSLLQTSLLHFSPCSSLSTLLVVFTNAALFLVPFFHVEDCRASRFLFYGSCSCLLSAWLHTGCPQAHGCGVGSWSWNRKHDSEDARNLPEGTRLQPLQSLSPFLSISLSKIFRALLSGVLK